MITKKRKMNKNKFKLNEYLFSITIIMVGFLFGVSVSHELHDRGLLNNINQIEDTIQRLVITKSFSLLFRSFFTHFIYIFAIWFLALTIIGIILVVIIVFFIGFMYGLVISSFAYQLGIKGFWFGLIYTFPQNVIIVPLVIWLSTKSISLSWQIFNRKNLKTTLDNYYNNLFFAIGVLIIYALIMSIFGQLFINILNSLL